MNEDAQIVIRATFCPGAEQPVNLQDPIQPEPLPFCHFDALKENFSIFPVKTYIKYSLNIFLIPKSDSWLEI